MRGFKLLLLSAVVAAIAGCAAKPAAPTGRAGAPVPRQAIQTSQLPARGDHGPGRFQRLPQLRLDSGTAGPGRAQAQVPNTPGNPQAGTHSRPSASRATPGAGVTSSNRAGFVLGEGDVIKFSMFDQPGMTTQVFVSAAGRVSLPLVGAVDIGGLAPSQAEKRIAKAYRDGGYFNNPQVNVTVEQYRSRRISVLGQVNKPGRYPLKTQTTVLDALAQAQGEKPTGSHVVTVIRKTGGHSRYTRVNIDALLKDGDDGPASALHAGDVVYVPKAKQFYIYGQVQKPDAYAIRPGMTVMQAIAVGGGLTAKGSDSRIEIRRNTGNDTRRFAPELTDRVRPGDVIFVKERFF